MSQRSVNERVLLRLATGLSIALLTIGLLGCFVMAAGSYKNQCTRDGPFAPDNVRIIVDNEGTRSLGVWPLWRQCTWSLEGGGKITVVDPSMYGSTLTLYGVTAAGAAVLLYARLAKRSARRAHVDDDTHA
ncbi:hypothetical protein SAMN04515692_108125 [Leifsonia sp. CL147]|nr:hypothetical protein SAMN04515694_10811 [Leifsonia sp. CL154]SFL64432.1 hypothetical protein SAMN04515692_108125 [Leifsonia sp. CL147]